MKSKTILGVLLCVSLLSCTLAVAASGVDRGPMWRPAAPVAEEVGTAGLYHSLLQLPVVARFASIGAHPDDDDSALLAYVSRGLKALTANVIANRGQGGQNAIGIELYNALGVVRTEELLSARRIDGAKQYFFNAYDFGFSKSKDETLELWGKDAIVEEVVKFIRMWRPNVVLNHHARETETRSGHGHHQAMGEIVETALKLAADPNAFQEHFEEGLYPWQVQKVYLRESDRSSNYHLEIDKGKYDPVLGRSYTELGAESRSNHRTQTMGQLQNPGRSLSRFRLLENHVGPIEQEDSFFAGIDTSLPGIANWAGDEESKVPSLRDKLTVVEKRLATVIESFDPLNPDGVVDDLAFVLEELKEGLETVSSSELSAMPKDLITELLQQKIDEAEEAIVKALGLALYVFSEEDMYVPGEVMTAEAVIYNRSNVPVTVHALGLTSGEAQHVQKAGLTLSYNDSTSAKLSLTIPEGTPATRIHWEVPDQPIGRQGRLVVSEENQQFALLPFRPFPVNGFADITVAGQTIRVDQPCQYRIRDRVTGERRVGTAVLDPVSVRISPATQVIVQKGETQSVQYTVDVTNNDPKGSTVTVSLNLPDGFTAAPESAVVTLPGKGTQATVSFTVTVPQDAADGKYKVKAFAKAGERVFTRGYEVIDYPHIERHFLYSPAESTIVLFPLNMAKDLNVGYVMGPEDGIPESLSQVGINVTLLTPEMLESGDLSQFDTIVTGRMAYEFRPDLVQYNDRLLKWVEEGGVLIVQYVRYPLNNLNVTPYPAAINRPHDRVTYEDAPVTILVPEHPIFNHPNKITEADFDGWVQERGLYFLGEFDERYTPLLECNDPGEEPKKGGLVYTRLGKGAWIYTGYAFFRQIPEGVPGGYRLFANMLCLPLYLE